MATVFNNGAADGGLQEFAPRADWGAMCEAEHFVQFYDQDVFLLTSLGEYACAGLGADEACIVVATKEHRDALEDSLRSNGIDLMKAVASGQYITLDAQETLSKLMVEGQLEPRRFQEIIGGLVSEAMKARPRLRIFGEMVALLWAEGKQEDALSLEGFWNELRKEQAFSLFCAYPLSGFSGQELAEPLRHVCSTHSRVIPSESYSALSNVDDRLRTIILLQQQARSLEAEIAERKEAEAQLRASLMREQTARVEAERANRLKDEFLATVSHELRTPLNAIIGWSHMLRQGRLDERMATRAVETIERNAQSQAQLVEDILDVSRMITGKLRLNIGAVDLAAVINAAIDCVQLAADAKEIQLEVRQDPSARHVNGDASRLQQVVWNLLSNAIKFTPHGGRVSVKLERAGSTAQLSVRDTGEGIEPNVLPYIFDRFRQGDGTSTRRHGGLGLGLAIVRHLVELHGGTVQADSSGEGLGSTFTVGLPLAPAPELPKKRAELESLRAVEDVTLPPALLPTLEGVRVLLVDDDADTLQMLTAMLAACKAEVHATSSAAEALEALQWHKPDVLVSDLAMPCEDGYSLISKVRASEAASGKRVPAVALTAYIRIEDRTRALSAGFNLFVPKPVEPRELLTAIANLAEHDAS
ncbi:MAG: MEDS domain-containing protein [Acidobacteria bacterium]|nr:MEDS domain-containing protein [Acidobacteriota bacterium]